MKKYVILGGLALIALFFAARFFIHPVVDVANPKIGLAVQAVYATGTVEPSVMLPIAARASAKLSKLYVDEGASVKKGQVLAQLDDTDLQSIIKQLRASELFAKQEYDRQIALYQQKYNSKAVLDKAKSVWDAAKAAVEKAEADASFLQLIAPADGVIIKRDGEIGQIIPAQQAVLWLTCCAPLRISVEVDEEDIAKIQIGQSVLIRADAFPDQNFNGKIQALTPKGDPISRTYRVRVELVDEAPLRIGMSAETNIMIQKKDDALLVPASAIVNKKLWLVRDGKLAQADVKIGIKGLKQTEILEGVNKTDLIVTTPNTTLKIGANVRSRLIETTP